MKDEPEEIGTSTEWWLEYRNPFNKGWARTGYPQSSEEAARRTLEMEAAQAYPYWVDLRAVEVTTVITRTVLETQRIEGRDPKLAKTVE